MPVQLLLGNLIIKMISLEKINKKYKSKKALQNFNLEIKKGEVHALIGPNGSGKTTAIGVILSLLNYEGIANVNVKNKQIGVSLENDFFFERLSVYDNLKFSAISKSIPTQDIDRVVEMLYLKNEINNKLNTLSKGNRRKVSLASALLGNSELYIFDEPLSGLDHDNIVLFRNLITSLKEQGKTILISSHILSEIEKMCTNFTFIYRGQIRESLSSKKLFEKYASLEVAYDKIIPKSIKFQI